MIVIDPFPFLDPPIGCVKNRLNAFGIGEEQPFKLIAIFDADEQTYGLAVSRDNDR